eukprot:4833880-Pleurochrysis_carterae.AAC.5
MFARKSRARPAVVAAELEEASAVDAVAMTAGFASRRAHGLATLILCNVPPVETVVSVLDLTVQRSWQARCLKDSEECCAILHHVVAVWCG